MPARTRRNTSTPLPSDPGFGTIPVDPMKYQITVAYPRLLRHQRVETVTVSLAPQQILDSVLDIGPIKSMTAIPVRLVIPGAILLPTDQSLMPTPFAQADAVFHVTAIAEGILPDCRVELFRHGKVEAIPLPLRSSANRGLAWWAVLTFLIPFLLYLPTCWPSLAENGNIERAVASWVPGTPLAAGRAVQVGYAFLAATGRSWSLSFFAFLAMLSGTTLWALSRRPTVETASNEPFLLLPATGSNGKVSPSPAHLMPVSTDDFGDSRR